MFEDYDDTPKCCNDTPKCASEFGPNRNLEEVFNTLTNFLEYLELENIDMEKLVMLDEVLDLCKVFVKAAKHSITITNKIKYKEDRENERNNMVVDEYAYLKRRMADLESEHSEVLKTVKGDNDGDQI